jgi:plastocyanin
MKRSYAAIALIIVIVIIAGVIVIYQGRGSGPGSTPQENLVSIVDFNFQPSSITVSVGTTVTWKNNGGVTHTVTSTSGLFNSGNISPGANFQFTFENAGTYTYHCSIHTSMTGTVIVH